MTEDEAKTKWCHRFTSRDETEDQRCIGSACMAWRILRVPEHYAHGSFKVTIGPEGKIAPLDQKPAQGFCGLAGHP